MHDCDLMICIGARFDDRITGRLDAFSPGSKKIHVDIDPSSINKNVKVDVPIVGDCAHVLDDMMRLWRTGSAHARQEGARRLVEADRRSGGRKKSLAYRNSNEHHQAAIRDPAALRADQGPRHLHHHRGRPAPDVGGAVLRLRGAEPLDDLGRARHHGLWPAGGDRACRSRIPTALVIDIAGEASVLMNIQEMSTAVQYACRSRSSSSTTSTWAWCASGRSCCTAAAIRESYTEALPDFVKLAEAYHAVGIRCEKPGDLDDAIREMIDVKRPVIFDCVVDQKENCFPMIPSGRGAQRDAPRRRCRGHRGRHHRGRQGAGVMNMQHQRATHQRIIPPRRSRKASRATRSRSRRQRAGRAGARHRPVLRPRLQYRSLTVSETEHEKQLSRITIVTRGTPMVIEQIKAQLDRLVPVHKVVDLTCRGRRSERELALVKVRGKGEHRVEALRLADAFRARVVDADHRELRLRDHRRQRQDRAASSR